MLKFTLKVIKYIKKNNYNKQKYIKINTKNIYNYITDNNIKYINDKINSYGNIIYYDTLIDFSLLDSLKINKQTFIIKDKNLLIIEHCSIFIDYYNFFIFININNLDDIKIYKYNNKYIISYSNLLNNIYVRYINSFSLTVYNNTTKIKFIKKNTETNLNIITGIRKNRLNNKNYKNQEFIFHYKNFKINKIEDIYPYNSYIFYYINYKIYINYKAPSYVRRYYTNLSIRKIKFLLI